MPDLDPEDLPCPEMLVGCTLALMTAYATALVQNGAEPQAGTTPLLGRKVLSQLCRLQQHPQLPPRLRQVAAQAKVQWRTLVEPTGALWRSGALTMH